MFFRLATFLSFLLCSFSFSQELGNNQEPLADIPINSPPIIENNSGQAFNDAPVNIQLAVSDQDGDDLTFTILTQPPSGSIIITQTQGGGTLDKAVATYTPEANFTGSVDFTYKANDGSEDSNIGTVTIYVYEKETNLMWSTYYAVINNNGNYFKIKCTFTDEYYRRRISF